MQVWLVLQTHEAARVGLLSNVASKTIVGSASLITRLVAPQPLARDQETPTPNIPLAETCLGPWRDRPKTGTEFAKRLYEDGDEFEAPSPRAGPFINASRKPLKLALLFSMTDASSRLAISSETLAV